MIPRNVEDREVMIHATRSQFYYVIQLSVDVRCHLFSVRLCGMGESVKFQSKYQHSMGQTPSPIAAILLHYSYVRLNCVPATLEMSSTHRVLGRLRFRRLSSRSPFGYPMTPSSSRCVDVLSSVLHIIDKILWGWSQVENLGHNYILAYTRTDPILILKCRLFSSSTSAYNDSPGETGTLVVRGILGVFERRHCAHRTFSSHSYEKGSNSAVIKLLDL